MANEKDMRPEDLIAEYEKLRKLANRLDETANVIERRLVELEGVLLDEYCYPRTATNGSDSASKKSEEEHDDDWPMSVD